MRTDCAKGEGRGVEAPPTIIVRHSRENPRKCSILPLRGRPGIVLLGYPLKQSVDWTGYVRLAADGPDLSVADAPSGLLVLDGSWRAAAGMTRHFESIPARALRGFKTAYPRQSKLGTDPANGLASVEALYIAHLILGRPTAGLLDHYHWREEFLRANSFQEDREGELRVPRGS
jgi:pre-rRNA-processing protein TSR3